MRNIILVIVSLFVFISCDIIISKPIIHPWDGMQKYIITEDQKQWIIKFYNEDIYNQVKDIIYYKDLTGIGGGQYCGDVIYYDSNNKSGQFSEVLHEIMHYYQDHILHHVYDGIYNYNITLNDIDKTLGSEQEARAIEWVYWYEVKTDGGFEFQWSEDRLKILDYLKVYLKNYGLLGGL